MNLLLKKLKECAENIPEPLGRWLVHVPFSWRLGKHYTQSQAEITKFAALDADTRRDYIFRRIRAIIEFAARENAFYRDFYSQRGFRLEQLRSYDDIQRVPIVTKADLRRYDLEARSNPQPGRLRTNTGGTSGEPLDFYLDAHAFAREWAHMHYIWSQFGYTQTDLKLTFRGRNLRDLPLKYNCVHNEYVINTYHDLTDVAQAIRAVAKQRRVTFLHGYPSAIYNFASYCIAEDPALAELLGNTLRGILLGSEFPAPVYRDVIEETFGVPTLSWYGHSEMAVLAYEIEEKFLYAPMQTYGYCEAVPAGIGEHRLVGTSYYNVASPFIRYDTGDRVIPEISNGLLDRFQIASGRVGGFILDKRGQRISLTALIFGRHHPIFGVARFVQVRQEQPGEATIMVTLPAGTDSNAIDFEEGFDLTNVAVDFGFEVRSEPVRSATGKVPLLIPADSM